MGPYAPIALFGTVIFVGYRFAVHPLVVVASFAPETFVLLVLYGKMGR